MYKISPNIYTTLAEHLFEEFRSLTFYSGVIEFEIDEIEVRFVSTLIPYFKKGIIRESEQYTLDDIVPVWWELHTTTPECELINDFDFDIFKNYIIQ